MSFYGRLSEHMAEALVATPGGWADYPGPLDGLSHEVSKAAVDKAVEVAGMFADEAARKAERERDEALREVSRLRSGIREVADDYAVIDAEQLRALLEDGDDEEGT